MKTYYLLTKPGILFGNLITTVAGFMLASQGRFDVCLFFATLIGLSLVIASACVLNNYIDREADKKMARTKNRALARGLISERSALLFALVLGLLGILALAFYVNLLAMFVALAGFLIYVVLYSLVKYHSTYATLVGSIAGAMPPVVGYCAVSGQFDASAILLFLILVLWQMPHFYSIAIYRFKDYAAASIPVLPVKKGRHITKVQMLLYIIAFIIAAALLPVGVAYLIVTTLLGIIWLGLCIAGFTTTNDALWARRMFRFSLVVILGLSVMIAVETLRIGAATA